MLKFELDINMQGLKGTGVDEGAISSFLASLLEVPGEYNFGWLLNHLPPSGTPEPS